ncbi:hypothetical protein DRN86_04830 [Candidatus Geothermarchaeota archaeon]|nr:MAG: hypothetical protein DRN86_04830 [Candidatus Geothermarchaeota archaeon]
MSGEEILKEDKNIVVPGEVVERDPKKAGENTKVTERGVVSTRLGVIQKVGRKISIIPYSGPYRPRDGDLVIGVVVGYAPNGWFVDIGAGVKAFLPATERFKGKFDPRIHDLKEAFKLGDVLAAKILVAERLGAPLLTLRGNKNLGKMSTNWFIKVPVVKIARIIGKKGSMLRILEKGTNSRVMVGQNGVLAIEGTYEAYVKIKKAVNLISEKTFLKGLTEQVSKLIAGEENA